MIGPIKTDVPEQSEGRDWPVIGGGPTVDRFKGSKFSLKPVCFAEKQVCKPVALQAWASEEGGIF